MKIWMPITAALAVASLLLVVWFVMHDGDLVPSVGGVRPSGLSAPEVPYTGAPLSADYNNRQFEFSLAIPEGYTAGELPQDEQGGTAIIIQDQEGNGIQIYVSPADPHATTLTEEDIRTAIPGLMVEDVEVVEIGTQHKGVAFRSDNEAYGGDSREVWFYFRGNLYQISTYARLDPLLRVMFSTWNFH